MACKAVGYVVFNASKLEQAKALFLWAHGDGLNKPSLQDVDTRVLELMDPKKAAEKQAEKAAKKDQPKPADADALDEEADETPEPENLVSTEPDKSRPAPNWKDVPEGMVALLKEGMNQAPGHHADLVRDFAKQFIWTAAMV
ncbi:MAG TPA: hypothetical protein VKE94_08535 [Gemmataceae bacterium]|nr:hypothetical protein [Gemmataceae bacterium]